MNFQDLLPALKVIKEIIVIVSAVGGVYIAGSGLVTWRKQLAGAGNHKLAKDLSLELIRYKYFIRDLVKHHYPHFNDDGSLKYLKVEDGNIPSPEKLDRLVGEYEGFLHNIESYLLEVEALWSGAVANDINKLLGCCGKVLNVVYWYEKHYNFISKPGIIELTPEEIDKERSTFKKLLELENKDLNVKAYPIGILNRAMNKEIFVALDEEFKAALNSLKPYLIS